MGLIDCLIWCSFQLRTGDLFCYLWKNKGSLITAVSYIDLMDSILSLLVARLPDARFFFDGILLRFSELGSGWIYNEAIFLR